MAVDKFVTKDYLLDQFEGYDREIASNKYVSSDALDNKVDKISGKGLSKNDYSDSDKAIVDGVTGALANKQDLLIPGTGISIENNVISATGGSVVANPSGSATDDLTKIQIDSTIYDLPDSGTTVVANPSGSATDELEKVQIGSTVYSLPKNEEGLIPKMTSNTMPSGIASVSNYSERDYAYKAFDGDDETYVSIIPNSNEWIAYDFDDPIEINAIHIKGNASRSSTGDETLKIEIYDQTNNELIYFDYISIVYNEDFVYDVNLNKTYTTSSLLIKFIAAGSSYDYLYCKAIQLYKIPNIYFKNNLYELEKEIYAGSRNYIRNFKLKEDNLNAVCKMNAEGNGYEILSAPSGNITFTFTVPKGEYIFSIGYNLNNYVDGGGIYNNNWSGSPICDLSKSNSAGINGNNGFEADVVLTDMETYELYLYFSSTYSSSYTLPITIRPMARLATDTDSHYEAPIKTNAELQYSTHIYTNDELRIGNLNGKALYSKTASFMFGGTATSYSVDIDDLDSSDVSEIWLSDGYINDGTDFIPLNYYDGTHYFATKISTSSTHVALNFSTNNSSNWNSGNATVYYTKS